MIDLHCLATAINDILGDKYVVWLNTNAEPEESETRTVVTMSAARIPFAYTTEELDAESLTLTLTFDLPVAAAGADLITRDIALNDIHNLLIGWRKIEVLQPSDNPNVPDRYAVTVRFEQQAPANPYTDTGHVKQQIVIGGTALAQNVNCKALVGNFVVVSINDTPLLKVSRVSNTQVGADNNLLLSEQKTLPEMHCISRISTKTLTFLYLGNDIEDEFLKIAEGVEHDVNKIYTYAVSYPNFTLSQKFKIAGVSSQDSAGVYLQYTLNVQLVEPAYVVEPPEDDEEGGGNETPPEGGDGGETPDPNPDPNPEPDPEPEPDNGTDNEYPEGVLVVDGGISGEADWQWGAELIIPEDFQDVSKINDYAFEGNTSLELFIMRTPVSYVGTYAFANCSELRHVYIALMESPMFRANAFSGCEKLERIMLGCTFDDFRRGYLAGRISSDWLGAPSQLIEIMFTLETDPTKAITTWDDFKSMMGG